LGSRLGFLLKIRQKAKAQRIMKKEHSFMHSPKTVR